MSGWEVSLDWGASPPQRHLSGSGGGDSMRTSLTKTNTATTDESDGDPSPDERQLIQAKLYISWMNYRLEQVPGSPQIANLFEDLRDGKLLLALLSVLTGQTLKPSKGDTRVHHLNNLSKVFQVLQDQSIKLVGIHNESICDGHTTYTLGLCWRIIYHFQVLQGMGDRKDAGDVGNPENDLLQWCSDMVRNYLSMEVANFKPNSWKNGYILNALMHCFDTELFDYSTIEVLDDERRLQHAIEVGFKNYAIPKLFAVDDFDNNLIDDKTLVLYVSMIRERLKEEALPVLDSLKSQLMDVRQKMEEKEASKLIHLPPTLSFDDSKNISKEYKTFQKELQHDLVTLQNVEVSIKLLNNRLPVEDINASISECAELSQRVRSLQDDGSLGLESVHHSKIQFVKEKLKERTEALALLQKEADERLPEELTNDTPNEVLRSCERLSKEVLGEMAQMQLEVKSTCSLVDETYKDKSLKKDVRSELKDEALIVLENYAKLMTSIEDQQKKAGVILAERLKDIEEKFGLWKDRLKDLDTWLDERLGKYENIQLKYDNFDQLQDNVNELNELSSRMRGEKWKEFELITSDWNGELCDEVNDDKYADILSDIQAKFNKLHQIATRTLTQANGIIKQKKDLEAFNSFVDQHFVHLVSDQNPEDDTYLNKLRDLLQEIESKEGDVKTFLDKSCSLIQENNFEEDEAQQVETSLQEFSDRWDILKDTCAEKYARMNYSDQLLVVQRETTRNLMESLSEWKVKLKEYTQRLHTITLDQYTSTEEVEAAIGELELLYSEVEMNDETLEQYDRDTNLLLDTLEEEQAADMSTDHFQKFFKEWEDLKGSIRTQLTNLKENMAMEFENEAELMLDWENKSMLTEELMKVILDVMRFCEEPESLTNYDEYLQELHDLEVKVLTHVDIIDSNLTEFKDLEENQLKVLENRDTVKLNIESIILKKNNLLEKLIDAKETAVSLVDRLKIQDQKEDDVRSGLERWEQILDDNTETLDRCDISQLSNLDDTVKAIHILETLLTEIGTHDEDLSVFEVSSLEEVGMLRSTSSAQIAPLLRNFFKNWDLCKSKAQERLNGLKGQLIQFEKNERNVMSEWREKVAKTSAWLDEVIAETKPYCQLPQPPLHLENHLQQFQQLLNKISSRLELVKDYQEHGRHLVDNDQVQKQSDKDVVLADVEEMMLKEGLLQENLDQAHTINDILRNRLAVWNETARNIDESVAEWQVLLDMYEDRLNNIDTSFNEGENDAQKTIGLLTVLLSDIESHQENLDAFKENTAVLIDTLNSEQVEKANSICQLFFKNWNFNWSLVKEKLNTMEAKVRDDLAASEKIAAEWRISSNFISDWLTEAENDINHHVMTGVTNDTVDTYHLRAEEFYISEATPRELLARLDEEGKEVSEQINHYLGAVATCKGLEGVVDYQRRKMVLDNKLLHAALLLDEIDVKVVEVEELRSKLMAWWEVLRTKTCSFEEIQLEDKKQEALTRLMKLISEAETKTIEEETFTTASMQTLDHSPFLKKMTAALKDDIQHFQAEWVKSTKFFVDAKTNLEAQVEQEHLIMEEWHHRTSVTEEIFTIDKEISVYMEAPAKLEDFEEYLSKFEELESKVLGSSSVVDESIKKGSEIYDTVSEDNKEKIKKVVDAFTHKKSKLQENLAKARSVVDEVVENKRKQKDYGEEFESSFTEWRRILEEWTATLSKCSIDRTSTIQETKKVISILDNVLSEINLQESKLDDFHQHAEELLAALDAERSVTWKMELKLFISTYQHLKDKVQERLQVFQNSLNVQLSQDQSNETAIMEDWIPSTIRTLTWLRDAENECATYSVVPEEDDFDVHKFIAEFEGFAGKIHAKLEYINEQKVHGRDVLEKLIEQVNKDKVNNDLALIEGGEEKLIETLSATKNIIANLHLRVSIMKESQRNLEESLLEWQNTLHAYMDRYDDINVKYDHEVYPLETTVTLIKELLSDFNGKEDQLHLYDQTTQALLLTIDSEVADKLRAGIQTFFSNWKLRLNNYNIRLQGVEGKLKKELLREERTMEEWLNLSIQVEKWLDRSESELDTYTRTKPQIVDEEEAKTFHKIKNDDFYLSEAIDKKLVKRLTTEGTLVDEQLKRCSTILKDGHIKNPENTAVLSSAIKNFIQRKDIIDTKLNHAKILLDEMFEQVSNDDATKAMFVTYGNYLSEKKVELDDVQTSTNISCALLNIEVMALDMSKKTTDMDSSLTTAINSLSNNKYHKMESNHLQQKLQAYMLEWNEFEEALKSEKERLEEKMNMMVAEEEVIVVVDDVNLEVYAANEDFEDYFSNIEVENEEKLNSELSEWIKILDDNNETLSSCKMKQHNTMEQTQLGITTLENLLTEIGTKEEALLDFETTSQDMLQTIQADKVREINAKLKSFFKKWNQCNDIAIERLNGLRLHYVQFVRNEKMKDGEIKLILKSWKQYLKDKKEEFTRIGQTTELDVVVQELKVETAELNLKSIDVRSFVTSNSHSLNLKSDLEKFMERWDKFIDVVRTTYEKLNANLEEQRSNDEQLMEEWSQKRMMTEELLKVNSEIRPFAEQCKNIQDYDSYFNNFNELECKVGVCDGILDETIKMGKDLMERKLKQKKSINKVNDNIESLIQQKADLLQTLVDAKLMVSELSDKRKMQQVNESKVIKNLHEWQLVVNAHNDTLNKCDIDQVYTLATTQKAIKILESLLDEMNASGNDIVEFDRNSQKLLNTLDLGRATSLNVEVKLFFKTWDHCKDKTTERLHGMKVQLTQLLKNEDHLMSEWESSVDRILQWFSDTELEASRSITESTCEKVHTKSEHIRELVGHGEHLIDSGIIQKEDNVHKIQNDITNIKQKEESLILSVDKSETLRREKSRKQEEDESKTMSNWEKLSHQISDWLENAERELDVHVREDELAELSDKEKAAYHLTTYNYCISENIDHKLVERLIEEGLGINEKVRHATFMVDDGNFKSAENCHRIQKDVFLYAERKRILTDKLIQAKALLDELAVQDIKYKEIATALLSWTGILEEKREALKELNLSTDKHNSNMSVTLQQIETLFTEVTSLVTDLASFVSTSSEALTSNKYRRHQCEGLRQQLQQLSTEWNTLKQNIHNSKDKSERSIKMQCDHEEMILKEWENKVSITQELLSACEDISLYCQPHTSVQDLDTHLARFDELQAQISSCGDQVDEMVDRGTGLLTNQLKIEENKERVQKDVNIFTQTKTSFLRDLVTANKMVLQLVELRQTQKENEETFMRRMTEWSNIVAINNEALDKCDITEIRTILQTETSIKLLEGLLSEIERCGTKLPGVESELNQLLETLEAEKVALLRTQLMALLQKWDRCKEKATERLAGLRLQLIQLCQSEKDAVDDWNSSCSKTMVWLEEMETESQCYCALPQQGTDMTAFLNNFQNALIKVDAKVEQIGDVKEHGNNLLMQHKIQITENRDQVTSDIALIVEKLTEVQQKLSKAKKVIQKRSKYEKVVEEKIMSEWMIISKEITTWLDNIETEIETDVKGDIEFLEEGYSLIDRLMKEGVDVAEKLKEGSYLADNPDLRTAELREGILKDVQMYTKRKFLIDQKTVQAKALLDAVNIENGNLAEMIEKLSQWRKFLHAKRTARHNQSNEEESDVNITMKNIETILLELTSKQDEFDVMLTSSEEQLSSHQYSKEKTSAVRKEFQQIVSEWTTLIDALQQSKDTLQQRIEDEASYEERMMSEWEDRALVTEELLVSIEEIRQYAEAPNSVDDLDDFLSKFEELEGKVQDHDEDVSRNIDRGTELHGKTLKLEVNKAKVQNAVHAFTQRHSDAKQTVAVAKRMVTDLVTKRHMQKETEERIRERLSTWRSTLDNCNESLGQCNVQDVPDIHHAQKCIDVLETLVSELGRKDVKVAEFDVWAHQQIKTLQPNQITSLTQQLKVFVSNWDRCADKAAERLSGFKMQLIQMEKAEKTLMAEWSATVDKTMNWFEDTEELIRQNEKVDDLHFFLVKFEELEQRVKVKVEDIREKKEQGDHLIDTDKLQLKEHKTQVIDDMAKIAKQLNSLLESLSYSRIRAVEFRDRLSADRDDEDRKFTDWQGLLDEYVLKFDECSGKYEKGEDDIKTTTTLLHKLLSEVKAYDAELELFKESSAKDTFSSRDVDQASLMKNLFFKNWQFNKNNIMDKLTGLEKRLSEDRENEERTMSEWLVVSDQISSWLDKAENQFTIYLREEVKTLPDADALMYHLVESNLYISECVDKKLVERLSEESKIIGEKVHQADCLVGEESRLRFDENRQMIHEQIAVYMERKQLLDGKLSQASKLLSEFTDQVTQDDQLKEQLNQWMKYLGEKNKALNNINTESLDAALNHVHVIMDDIKLNSDEVEEFVKTSERHLMDNKFNKTKSAIIKEELSIFFTEWNKLSDSVKALEKCVLSKLSSQQEAEEEQMSDWCEHVRDVIELWLQKYEIETKPLINPPQDMDQVEQFAAGLEKLVSMFTADEVGIDKNIKHSSDFVDSGKLTLDKNKQAIRKSVSDFSSRKLALNNRLLNAQKWLTSARDRMRSAETEELSAWFSEANVVKDKLRNYESYGREEAVTTVKEGELALQKQLSLIAELEENESTIKDLLRRGEGLITDKSLSRSKHNEVAHEVKIIEQRWQALKDRIKDVKDGYEKIIVTLKIASEEKVSSILTRVSSINDWLIFTKQQLHEGSQPITFTEHMQREVALRKISSDLETQSREFDYLQKILLELTSDKLGELSDHDGQLIEGLQRLNIEWMSLTETIANELNTLYESVSSLLDTRRVQIRKSLDLLQSNLQGAEVEKSVDKLVLKDGSRRLSELNEELINLKGDVGRLKQETSTLNETSVFVDKLTDKELHVQSTDHLLTQYEHCGEKVAEVTSRFRSSIVEYLSAECEAAKQKLDEYECGIPTYNAEEEDLNVLKEFLIQNQRIVDVITSEQLQVDDLELFAEEISRNGVLTDEDQVTIAENVNTVFKAFDQLRSQINERTSKVYAVTMHIYNHHIHRITEELNRVKEEAQTKIKELIDVKEFTQAIDTLLLAQKLSGRTRDLSNQIAFVTEQMIQWTELRLIEQTDAKRLKEKDSHCITESLTVSKDVENLLNRVEDEIRAIALKRVSKFRVWLPTVQKRSEEGDEIGPDFDAVTKQIQEMKVLQALTIQMSFSSILDPYKSKNILDFLTEEERTKLRSANDEWIKIKNWVDKRLEMLGQAEEYWDDFKARKLDLVEYLRDIEHELKSVVGIDLNNTQAVELRSSKCLKVTGGMEARKDHVAGLIETADRLANLLTTNDENKDGANTVPNSIRTQVADILDSWNIMVKRSIELKSKLQMCVKKFNSSTSLYQETRDWVDDCIQLLGQFTVDESGEYIDILRVKLEAKQNEEEVYREKLYDLNMLDDELSREGEVCPTYTLPGAVKTLNKDFTDTIENLDKLKKFPGKVKMLSRRVRGGTTKLTRNLTSREGTPFSSPVPTTSTS